MDPEYSMNYSIGIPRLKKRDLKTGKVFYARFNNRIGDWTYQYDDTILQKFGLNRMSFAFFVLWNDDQTNGPICNTLWLKREISIHDAEKINLRDGVFMQKLLPQSEQRSFFANREFCRRHGLNLAHIIIKDLQGKRPLEEENVAIEVFVSPDETKPLSYAQTLTYAQFKQLLIERSNGPVYMGKKGLNYSETDLEKFLAIENSGALFPGDCDMLLFDNNYRCRYIIEFKKCTDEGQYCVQDQTFMNYYDNPKEPRKNDKLKYRRLNILRKHFETIEGYCIPLVNVFYPTTKEEAIKIEFVEEGTFDLCPGRSYVFKLGNNPKENQTALIETIMWLEQQGKCDEEV